MKLNSLIKSNVNPVNMIKVQFNDPSSASGYFDAYEGELKNLSAHYKNLKVINWCVKEVVNASATDVWLVVELKEKL